LTLSKYQPLNNYSRRKLRKSRLITKNIKNEQDNLGNNVKVRKLFNLWRALYKNGAAPGRSLEEYWSLEPFKKLHNSFIKKEKETGIKVDPAIFIVAQFVYWGDNCYPSKLTGEGNWKIYKDFNDKFYAHDEVFSEEKFWRAQEEMLEHLCECRNETEKEVIESLRKTSIFTDEFVMHVLASNEGKCGGRFSKKAQI